MIALAVVLAIAAVVAGLVGFSVLANAQSAIHEAEAFILFLIAAVLFCSACVVEAIRTAMTEVRKAITSAALEQRRQLPRVPIIVAAVMLFGLPSASAAYPQDDPRAYCEHLFRESYSMRLYCIKSENAAKDRITRRYYSFQSVDAGIWSYCGRLFDSWEMLEYCVNDEERSKRALGGR